MPMASYHIVLFLLMEQKNRTIRVSHRTTVKLIFSLIMYALIVYTFSLSLALFEAFQLFVYLPGPA